jgi:hypothetical protein
MASTSSSSSPRLRHPPSAFKDSSPKRNSDFFRSRPNDRFSNSAFHGRAPVVLNSESLYRAAATLHATRGVILILGGQCFLSDLPYSLAIFSTSPPEPSAEDIAPLLNSERLAFSLLIIASHRPPLIPPKVQPTVRILRLAEPLALEQFGAIRLVNVLEWAERVARMWRRLGGIGVEELAECDEVGFGALTPPDLVNRVRDESDPSPVSSTSRPVSLSSATSTTSLDKLRSWIKRLRHPEHRTPAVDPSQRPFDALVNYLPSNVSDKSLLKISILVTTVSRPFLVAVTPPSPRPQGQTRSSIFKRKSVYSMPPTPLGSEDSLNSLCPCSHVPLTKPHLVHLLPPRPRNSVANRLLDSIETFLLSFSFPLSSEQRNADSLQSARASFLETTAFAEPVGTPPCLGINWTVADILLSDCLDDVPVPRVWFSGASDIVVAALPHSQPSITPPPAAHCARCRSSSSAISPGSSHPSFKPLPTPPESEDGLPHRHTFFIKKRPDKALLQWKLWKRPISAPLLR